LLVAAGGWVVVTSAGFLIEMGKDSSPPALTAADAEGIWETEGESRLTVRADGSAQLQQVPEADVNCGQITEPAPLTYTGPATWVLDMHPDPDEGQTIRFDYKSPIMDKTCQIHFVVGADEHAGYGYFTDVSDVRYVRPGGRRS
jgi:hypothetical protein